MTLKVISATGMLAILSLFPAQAWPGKSKAKGEKTTTVTGCLIKGAQPNEFNITAGGTKYDLYPTSNLNMAQHVGHKVTVSGKLISPQPAGGANMASRTAAERLDVTKLKHVSNTCP